MTIRTNKTNKTIRIKTDRTNKTIRKFVRNHLNRPKVLIVLIVLSCLFHLSPPTISASLLDSHFYHNAE